MDYDINKLIEEGEKQYKNGELHNSLNTFLIAATLEPNNPVVKSYIDMLKSILNFEYKEYINV